MIKKIWVPGLLWLDLKISFKVSSGLFLVGYNFLTFIGDASPIPLNSFISNTFPPGIEPDKLSANFQSEGWKSGWKKIKIMNKYIINFQTSSFYTLVWIIWKPVYMWNKKQSIPWYLKQY